MKRESNMKSVNENGDLPSRKRYGKARENGLRGSEFHSLTVLVARYRPPADESGRRERITSLKTEE